MPPFSTSIRRLACAAALSVALGCATGPSDPVGSDDPIDSIPPVGSTDTVPPQRVGGLSLTYNPGLGDLALEWAAPFDDDPQEPASRYEVRFVYTVGYTPSDFWNESLVAAGPPSPADPGVTESYHFGTAERGKDFYAGVLAFDEEDNPSPASDVVTIHIPGITLTGRCVDALTGEALAGLTVRVTAGALYNLTTDANGSFSQDDVVPGAVHVRIEKGTAGEYHLLRQPFVIEDDFSHEFVMVPFQPTSLSPSGGNVLRLLKILTLTDSGSTVLAKWRSLPVPVHLPAYVNANGVDYQALGIQALERWNERSGVTLFEFSDTPPDTGVVVRYRLRQDMNGNTAITGHDFDADNHPIRGTIDIVDDFTASGNCYRVLLHEIGHTIRFSHMNTGEYIMYGGKPLPDDISDDEADAARLHAGLPVRVDMTIYSEATP
jgi:hypothetical protein